VHQSASKPAGIERPPAHADAPRQHSFAKRAPEILIHRATSADVDSVVLRFLRKARSVIAAVLTMSADRAGAVSEILG
jgi:hypothetical protein